MKQSQLLSALAKYPGDKDIKVQINGVNYDPKILFNKSTIYLKVETEIEEPVNKQKSAKPKNLKK